MAQKQQSNGLSVDEIIEKIIGFAERIDTPFGEMCSLSCDLQSNGRLYKPIEESIAKLRAHLNQRTQKQTYDGHLTHNMYHYSVNTILEFFGLNSKQYQIEECGSNEISPYTYLGKILQINYPNRRYKDEEENNNGAFNSEVNRVPQVYVTSSESYYNILPWAFYGCNMNSIEVNKQSEINGVQLIDKISKSSDQDLHIVSISAVSNITGQKIPNLESIVQSIIGLRAEMALRNKNIRIYFCLDITQLAQREKIDAKEGVFKDVDFFILQSSKLLGGGFDSTNILISKKESATSVLAPQRPLADNCNNILDSLTENNDPTKLYRVALSLQLLENITFEKIRDLEKKNIDLLLKEVASANKALRKLSVLRYINIWGVVSEKSEFSYGNIHLNIYVPGSEIFDNENKSYLHPDLVCQILHDIFGIQATMKRNVNLTDNIVMLNIPKNIASQLNSIGSSESMLGCISLDISFLHKEDEIKYITQALQLICEKGDEFIRYYDKKTFLMNNFNYDSYDLHLNQMLKVNDTREEVVKKRSQKYDAQISLAKTIFKNYTRYFSLHDGYTKEKTEQIKKKDIPFSMPPIMTQKSMVKLPDDLNDETVLNLQKVAIEKAQEFVKTELARIEAERLRLQKLQMQDSVVINTQPPPPITEPEIKIEPKEPSIPKDEMERQLQELIDKKLNEKTKKEKEDMEKLMEAMRKEMQEKIDQSSGYKEQFVFEDLQPSVMFKNVIDHREKRYRNLRIIFNNYAKLNLEQQELEPKKEKKSRFDIVTQNYKKQEQQIAYTINAQQFMMFCNQFNLFSDQFDANIAIQIYSKSLNRSISTKEMHFTEFISSLEKIALVVYYNNNLLITSFDKTEALYQFLEIDDVHKIKVKMSLPLTRENFSVNKSQYFGSNPSNVREVPSSHKQLSIGNGQSKSPGQSRLHQLDYDSGDLSQQVALQKKYVHNHQQPQNYSINSNKKNSNIFQNQSTDLNWNEINSVMVNPQSLFKNESNFLYHEYGTGRTSLSKVNSSKISKNIDTSQSLSYLSPNNLLQQQQYAKHLSQSPIKSGSTDMQKQYPIQNYSMQQLYGMQQSPESRKNNMIHRIKEIEDSEIKKQKDLLSFLQSNMSNQRYRHPKKLI
ncbi:hypothetical protein TTHERM_00088140 (macronuclear) [Tetrahymena thermophila SB210]|uniref:Aminotransferase class V domain-containing protein n=1 Tax=Tetrahymena thermophila (strain SB210) TaxID=312017 RepID=Q236I2_TETTS|nr:hypothetical protein TTHERM_00088140 [Tetrahymena thermophila SB210]EAR92518.2 hypothetical protein TTHERM_00088140 [Tetrahymena thermophila SB210]|eukprot:XP_001012763.2 hypothetical protein TTHERM_00088140 [Tetrahymena thermophila SB210]